MSAVPGVRDFQNCCWVIWRRVTPLCDGLEVQNYSDVIRAEVPRMRVLTTSELIAPDVAFEACDAFEPAETEPGICTRCGWLDDEHVAPAIAA